MTREDTMKYFIGFFFGIAVAGAMAAEPSGVERLSSMVTDVTMAAGVGPDGKKAPIRVDGTGHVICSTGSP
jgi:hypothetical protein